MAAMKTAYVLGAGFSYDAGIPVQGRLLELVEQRGLVDPVARTVLERASGGAQRPALEDIFTLFDQTIARRQFCLGYSWREIEHARKHLMDNILCVIHERSKDINNRWRRFYSSVVANWVVRRIAAGQETDCFSIISLNWDCLVEDMLYHCLREAGLVGAIDADFCCYTSPLSAECPHVPSVLQKAKGLFNIKIMKLHGSANWLLCPNCNRLYTNVGADDDEWSQYVFPQDCPECQRVLPAADPEEPGKNPELEPFFITPTYLKEFDNPHIQMIWHNAHMALAEADEIVFIGYSLPEADYHVRTLLRRAIGKDTPITAVLTLADEPKRGDRSALRNHFPAVRYRTFFGESRVSIRTCGMKGYFSGKINRKQAMKRLATAGRRSAIRALVRD